MEGLASPIWLRRLYAGEQGGTKSGAYSSHTDLSETHTIIGRLTPIRAAEKG